MPSEDLSTGAVRDSGAFTPQALRGDESALLITWSDGRTDRIPWTLLRERCPCATCRQKRAAPPEIASPFNILRPEEAAPLRVTGMHPVGNYAYQIDFSDGHRTGIFSLELLRDLGG